ncbi:MAG: hypothetical protein K5683_11835 [Prevotella sp.]|nr:hypothetical protein [Prevotella sp.]
MMDNITLNENEDYRDFVCRTLKGKVEEDFQEFFIFLLGMIITEVGTPAYSVSLTVRSKEITLSISHRGNPIRDNIISIINNQVDSLRYRYLSKTGYMLKIRKKIKENQKVNCLIFSQL